MLQYVRGAEVQARGAGLARPLVVLQRRILAVGDNKPVDGFTTRLVGDRAHSWPIAVDRICISEPVDLSLINLL